MQVSHFARGIEPSATLAAGAKARQLKSKGIDVFDFCLGEPDFHTPQHIQEAAIRAMAEGQTHYTPAAGIPALKKAVADYHRQRHGLEYAPEEVCVSSGCKHAIHGVLAATLNPGDEVIIPAPYWVSYRDLVKMTGAVPVIVPTTPERRFKMSGAELRAACTSKTRLLMLNSPSNPTGSVYSRAELLDLAEVVVDKGILVLTDEIYDRLLYGDAEFHAFAALDSRLRELVLTVNGVSKTFAMTGWRIGWTLGPKPVIDAIGDIQSQETGNPCSISQYAALAALTSDQTCVNAMLDAFAQRRAYVCQRIPKIPGLKLIPPDGAFYAFFDVSRYFGKRFGETRVADSASFCMAALEQAHVALVQGSAFGAEGYVRMSFATSLDVIERGLDALERWLATAA